MNSGKMYATGSARRPTTAKRATSPVIMSAAPSCRIERPSLGARRAEANEADRNPMANGMKVRPAARGLRPSPVWRYSVNSRKNEANPEKKATPIRVEPKAGRCTRLRHQPPCQRNRRDADGEVDEKYRAPGKSEHVGAHEQTAEHLAREHPQSDDHAVDRVRDALFLWRERHLYERECLRHHDGRERPLQHARSHQLRRHAGEPAQRREPVTSSRRRHRDKSNPGRALPDPVLQPAPDRGNRETSEPGCCL